MYVDVTFYYGALSFFFLISDLLIALLSNTDAERTLSNSVTASNASASARHYCCGRFSVKAAVPELSLKMIYRTPHKHSGWSDESLVAPD